MMMNHKIRKLIAMLKLSRSLFVCLHYELDYSAFMQAEISEEAHENANFSGGVASWQSLAVQN